VTTAGLSILIGNGTLCIGIHVKSKFGGSKRLSLHTTNLCVQHGIGIRSLLQQDAVEVTCISRQLKVTTINERHKVEIGSHVVSNRYDKGSEGSKMTLVAVLGIKEFKLDHVAIVAEKREYKLRFYSIRKETTFHTSEVSEASD
jgi:hypothetical protein